MLRPYGHGIAQHPIMSDWQPADTQLSDLIEGEFTLVELAGEELILTLAEGEPVAFRRTCPHASADLADGDLRRGRVTCPLHGYKFDMRTGRILYPTDESYRLRCFPIDVRDNELWLQLNR